MKKLFGLFVTAMLVLTSCGGVSQKSIDEKIEKDGVTAEFSQKEYEFMADYVISHFDEILSSQDENNPKALYMFVLLNADVEGKLDESVQKKCEEISKKAQEFKDNYSNF